VQPQALGHIKDAAAIPALCEALHDPSSYVRASADEALGQIKKAITNENSRTAQRGDV